MHLPSPEAVPSLPGSPVPRPLASPLTTSRWGPGRVGRPAYAYLDGIAFEGCCGCGARAGVDAGGHPRRRAGWPLQPADGWRQPLPAEAGRVGSPQSAPVQPGTAGPCYRLRRRRDQSGIQEPNLSASLCQPDITRGGAPGPQVWTSHDPERCGTELFQNFGIVTTPVHVPQCF